MPPDSTKDATEILNRLETGDAKSVADLMPLVYEELHRLAVACMANERVSHTLQPTALVNEAFVRLIDQGRARWNGRVHFVAVASEVIRRILVDHARARSASKRGGDRHRVDLTDFPDDGSSKDHDLLELDESLEALGRLHERQRRVVEMRFFGGLTIDETAQALGVSATTVKNDWHMARAWLKARGR